MAKVRLGSIGKPRQIALEYDGEQIEVVFSPAAINDYWLERLQGLDANDREGYAGLLAEALISWNIVDDEGQEIPPGVEILRKLPADFLTTLGLGIMEAIAPKARMSGVSAAT